MKKILLLLFLSVVLKSQAQENYPFVAETDPQALQKLEEWKDWKFGLLMHWGPYSEWGIVESWSLCPEDEGWTERKRGNYSNYFSYKMQYEALGKTFNPTLFNPEKWAAAAKAAGMRYMVFTTKHHDGFNMFDTKQTDYKITAEWVPYHNNARADVTKEIFNAFRKEGISVGAYFSKPDWNNENYWWPYFPPKDRNVNYAIDKYPERWKKFQDFTYNQIKELMTGYGKVDILWLDGGWVRPDSTVDRSVEWERNLPHGQDVNMPRIAKMCREQQPGIIIVDRWVPGPFENYHTPEQEIPKKPLPYPWETCMTMAGSWSYVPNDVYKPAGQIIHNLVEIVSRGGNYLLNIGPGPDGEWHAEAYTRLQEIGAWMKGNSEGIYSTRAVAPYQIDQTCFTESKDHQNLYAFRLLEDKETLSGTVRIPLIRENLKKVEWMAGHKTLKWKKTGDQIEITLPKDFTAQYAAGFKLSY